MDDKVKNFETKMKELNKIENVIEKKWGKDNGIIKTSKDLMGNDLSGDNYDEF